MLQQCWTLLCSDRHGSFLGWLSTESSGSSSSETFWRRLLFKEIVPTTTFAIWIEKNSERHTEDEFGLLLLPLATPHTKQQLGFRNSDCIYMPSKQPFSSVMQRLVMLCNSSGLALPMSGLQLVLGGPGLSQASKYFITPCLILLLFFPEPLTVSWKCPRKFSLLQHFIVKADTFRTKYLPPWPRISKI